MLLKQQIQMSVAFHALSSPELFIFNKHINKNNDEAQSGIVTVPRKSTHTVPQESISVKISVAKISGLHFSKLSKSFENSVPISFNLPGGFPDPSLKFALTYTRFSKSLWIVS